MRPIGPETEVVLNQGVELAVDELLEQRHEGEHLVPRSFPVLGRKGIQSDDIESQAGGCLDCFADRADAGAVAFDAWQVARLRPPTVAVHDDGDMVRQSVGVETLQQLPLVRAKLRYLIVWLHHSKHLDCEVYHSILVPKRARFPRGGCRRGCRRSSASGGRPRLNNLLTGRSGTGRTPTAPGCSTPFPNRGLSRARSGSVLPASGGRAGGGRHRGSSSAPADLEHSADHPTNLVAKKAPAHELEIETGWARFHARRVQRANGRSRDPVWPTDSERSPVAASGEQGERRSSRPPCRPPV